MTLPISPGSRLRTALAACGTLFLAGTVSACGGPGTPAASPSSHGSPSATSQGTTTRTFAFSGKNLTIDADGTSVDIVPGDVEGVRVRREIHGNGVEASWGLHGNTLTLKVEQHCHGAVTDCSTRHTVTVGRDVSLTVKSGTGSVSASHVTAPLSVTASTGSVKVSDSSGPIDLTTGVGAVSGTGLTSRKVTAAALTGSVDLDFSAVPDDVDASAHTGKVDIGLPTGGATYAVDAESKVGKAEIGVPRDSASTHSVKARTTVGSVSVHGR